MKKVFIFPILISIALLNSCNNDRLIVDISGIELELNALRLDQGFMPLDTINPNAVSELVKNYGNFTNFYLDTILQAGGVNNPSALQSLAKDPIYPLAQEIQTGINSMNTQVEEQLKDLELAFKHLKYYYPNHEAPEVVCYNSWFQYGTLTYDNYLGIGLDFFVADSALQRKYPPQFYNYMKQDMRPDLIACSSMYAYIANVMFPTTGDENSLLDNMILKGKQRYLLEAFMPEKEEHLIMQYTPDELAWCYKKELAIWSELTKLQENNSTLLFTKKRTDINRWIQPGPFTAALSEEATDRMGEWIGLQMVRDYMRENTEVSPTEMLEKTAAEIMRYYNPKK